MKRLIIIILLTGSVMSVFVISSCKKKVPNYYVSQGLKDWGYFNAGSQWLYRNDSTGVKETVWEDNNPQDIMVGGNDIGRYDEQITVNVSCSFMYGYILGYDWNPPYATDQTSSHTDKLELSFIYRNQPLPLLGIWPEEPLNDSLPTPGTQVPPQSLITEMITDYQIDTNHFSNVLHTTLTKITAYKYEFYFAKHIGLIHFSENNSRQNLHRSYSLVSWKMNP
ncbi:MAG: hypothetical protein ABSD71_12880 [Bacteroidales bacterium]